MKILMCNLIRVLIVSWILLFPSICLSQIETPVYWGYASKKLGNDQFMLLIRATIKPGWHIYAEDIANGGPVKTAITFDKANDYELIGNTIEPKPVTKHEAVFSMDVRYFEKEVIFQQKIKLNKPTTVVKGHIKFMSCTNKQCLPPDDVDFSMPIK